MGPAERRRSGSCLEASQLVPPTPPPEGAGTRTYPSCRRGQTHSTPGPAPRTRNQLAAAASLASCELCAPGGSRGAPSPSAWALSLGEDGELQGSECSLWPNSAGAGEGDAQLRGERLWARASWPVSVAGPERGSPEGRGEVGAHGTVGAQSPARGLHSPHTIAPWRKGDAGTVALAALACRLGAVRELEPIPARSASACSPG